MGSKIKKRTNGMAALWRRLGVADPGAMTVPGRVIDCMELEDRTLLSATPVGGEVLVNTETSGTQATQPETAPAVASDADGDTVVVWTSDAQDGDSGGIYAQRYNSSGVAQGSEFRVNATTSGNQTNAAVAMDDDGNFVVTWSSNGQDGDSWGVYARRYNASGVAQGGEFLVNTSDTSGAQRYSTVAMDDSGNFVITWTTDAASNEGVRAQRYNSSGVAQGSEIQVNTETNDSQAYSSIGMRSSGEFVITWSSLNQDGGGWGIYGQRFNADGTTAGSEFQVNTTTTGDQHYSRVAMDSSGLFVVVWQSNGQDGDGWGVYARAFDSSGTPVSGEVQVNTTTTNDQTYASVDIDADGNVIATWQSNSQDGSGWGVYARRYDSSMGTIDAEFRVNQTTSGDQQYASVAVEDNGDFVVAWSGNGSGDATGIFTRRYINNNAPTLDNTKSPTLAAMNEDAGAPSGAVGTLVSSLVDFASPSGQVDNVTDPDSGALLGIAVTAADTGNGTWWYSTNNGSSWTLLGAVTSNSARLLAADASTRLYFQPNANYNGTLASAITFRAWDQRTGSNGGTADTSNNGGGYAFSSATDTASLTVNPVNDAPVNTVPGLQTTLPNTSLVFSTANGNAISLADVDAGGASIQVTLAASNGTLTLNGTAGLSFSIGDGTTDATMSFTGTMANINAALNGLTFAPPSGFNGSTSIQIASNDLGNSGSGGALGDTDIVAINVGAIRALWLSTEGDVTNSGVPGLPTWTDGQVLQFSDPNMAFEPGTSSGTFSSVVNMDLFAADSKVDIDAIHYVSRTIVVGSGGNTITLERGDLLVSTKDDETLTSTNSLSVLNDEIFIYRPDTAGDYSSGTFTLLLDNFGTIHGGADTFSFTLVEAATTVGDTVLAAGSFLYSRSGGAEDNDIYLFTPTGVGAGTTAGSVSLFILGDDINIAPKIWGLELIEETTILGDATLTAGQLLVTIDADDNSAGTNNISIKMEDVFILDVVQTTLGSGTSVANATVFLQGIDVGLDAGAENPDALALVVANQPPTVTLPGGAVSYTEGDAATVIDAAATVSDSDSPNLDTGTLTVQFTAGGTADDRLEIRDQGAGVGNISLLGSNVRYDFGAGAVVIGTYSGGTSGSDPLVITFNTNSNVASAQALLRNITYRNVSESPSTAARTVSFALTDGDGGTSNTAVETINVTAVNDAPVNTVPVAPSMNEDVPLVFSSGNGNQISISDVDAGSSSVQVTLTGANGVISLAGITGLTFTSGDGTSDATMTFTGTIASINTALNGLSFSPTANFNGAASLQIITNDQGNSGSGGAQSDTDTVNITVNAVNDAPVNSVPGAQTVNEDTLLVFSSAGGNLISIADVDAGGSSVQVTLTGTNGVVTLAGVSGLAFSSGDGTSDATMTFTGTITNINNALNGLSFSPTPGYNGAASLQIVTNDQGNAGAGGALSDTDTVNITVNAINDAPVNSVPAAQAVNEDTALVFSSGNGNQISVADADVGAGSLQVTLTATNGTLSLNGTAGLSFTAGDGSADATMTFTGTQASINTALNGLSFMPTGDYNGAASVQIVTNDQGNTGSGGAQSDTDTVNITVNAVNDGPVNTVPGAQSTNEDTTLVFSSGNGNQISVTDVDSGSSPLQITLTAANGTLTLSGTTGLSFTAGDGTGDATMTFTGSRTDINTALNGLGFSPTLNYSGAASVQIVTNDQGNTGSGGSQSDTDTVNITVNAVNDAPANTVPAAQSTNEDTVLTFSSGGGNQISISDIDAGGSSVQVTLTATNGSLTLNGTAGLSFTTGDGTADATMTFTGTIVDINAALNGMSFLSTLDFNGAASLQIVTNDQGNTGAGGSLSDTDSVAITVNAVNDAPINTVPGAQSTNEDTPLVFSAAGGNQISISDLDVGSNPVQLTLTATNGTITLAGTSGLTFSSGDGTADAAMTFTGTIVDINAALNGLSFAPTPDFNGAASLQIITNDQGNTGAGGPQSDTDTVSITVNGVNDGPVNSVPGAQTTSEDTPLVFSAAGGNLVSLSDLDAGTNPVQVTLTATNGSLTLAGLAGLTFSSGDGTSDATMTFTGTVADINAALNGMSFLSTLNYNGAASLQIITNDQGNTGSGGPLSDTDTVSITVNAVNDAPVNNVPGAQSTNEDTPLVFSAAGGNPITISDVDASGSPVQVTLTAAQGTLTLASTSGLTFTSGDGADDGTMTFTGTIADINAALNGLSFSPVPDYNGAASLQIVTDDQGNTGAGGPRSDTDTVNITVNAVNDAPVLDNSGSMTLTTITEDDTNNSGDSVFSIIASAGGDRISDVDASPFEGIAITSLTSGNGAWQYSINGGGSWNAVGVVSETSALLLRETDRLRFVPDGLNADAASVTFRAWDETSGVAGAKVDVSVNGGTSAFSTASETASITVTAVNDAPLNTTPGPQSTSEDTPLVFSSGGGNQISIGDVDAAGGQMQVTLTAANGVVNLNGIVGLTFSLGDGAADATMTFTGTLADINAALNGLTFTPTPNFNGAASLQITTNDQGNVGAGGPQADSNTIAINVTAVNDAPVNTVPGPQATNDDVPLVFSAATGNQILISDLDAASGSLQVTLAATNGTFSLSGTAGLAFTTGDGTADGSMVFTGTLADINAALNGLVFTATFNFTGTATLALTTNDLGNTGSGGPLADSDTISIAVTAINEAPLNTVPTGQTIDEDTTLTFSTAGGNAISINDSDANPGQVEVTLAATNGTLTLNGTAGLTFTTGDGTADAMLVFTGTLANINAALDGLLFAPTLHFNGAASVQITTSDLGNTGSGGPLSDTDTVAITVNGINDAPLIAGPATQSTPEDNALIFSAASGNAIAITDVDSGGGLMQLTLTATQGTLTLASLAGLTFDAGDGTDDATLQVRGTLADINAALNGLRYTPDANYFGPAQVQIDVSDQGNSGAGGALVDAHTIAIDVVSQNDAPTVSVPAGQSLGTTTLVFSTAGGNAIVVGDLEGAGATPIEVTLTATGGTLTLASTSGLTLVSGTGAADAQIIVLGAATDINAALNGLVFQWDTMGDTPALLVSVNDLGTSGQGGALATSANIEIVAPPLMPPPSSDSDTDSDSDSDTEDNVTPGGLVPGVGDSPDTRDRRTDGSRADRRRPEHAAPPVAVSLAPSVSLVVAGGESSESSFANSLEASAQRLSGLAKAAVRQAQRQAMLDASLLWGQLDALADQLTGEDSLGRYTVGAAAGVSVALSAGYVAWCLRSGALLASAISSLPMWRSFDPLPVLEFWEKDKGQKTRRQTEKEAEEPLEKLIQELV